MKRLLIYLVPVLLCLSFTLNDTLPKKPVKVLVFSKTLGFRHKSIQPGIAAIKKLGEENGFIADTTEDATKFTTDNLKNYKAVIFLSPTGEVFNDEQKLAFQTYIKSGGGFVGIHAATDCLYKWEWYGKMIGGYFASHPAVQEAVLTIKDTKHPSTKKLVSPWTHRDEWYNFKYTNTDVKVLLTVDEKSYKGGKNGDYHPAAWYHEFEGGRVFYTALGHTSECYTTDENFLKHLMGGIKYALAVK